MKRNKVMFPRDSEILACMQNHDKWTELPRRSLASSVVATN